MICDLCDRTSWLFRTLKPRSCVPDKIAQSGSGGFLFFSFSFSVLCLCDVTISTTGIFLGALRLALVITITVCASAVRATFGPVRCGRSRPLASFRRLIPVLVLMLMLPIRVR